MNFASIVPLIGGETIAMENVFGKRPEYILTFDGFQANEEHLLNYYNNSVPYLNLSEGHSFTEKVDVIKFNNFTIDTSLQRFPYESNPQCIETQIKIINPPPTLVEMFIIIVLTAFVMLMPLHILCFADDKTRDWFIGYMIGRMLEEMFNND